MINAYGDSSNVKLYNHFSGLMPSKKDVNILERAFAINAINTESNILMILNAFYILGKVISMEYLLSSLFLSIT